MGANTKEFSEANFESDVLKSKSPVLVDFWAPWCAPCRQIGPMIDELATEYSGSVTIGKLNIDESQAIADKYSVHNIPTLIIFKNGQPVERMTGAPPKSRLQGILDSHKG